MSSEGAVGNGGNAQSSGAASSTIKDDDFVEVDLSTPRRPRSPTLCGPSCYKLHYNLPNLNAISNTPKRGSYPLSVNNDVGRVDCKACGCGTDGKPCVICRSSDLECEGTCYCCEGFRKLRLRHEIQKLVKLREQRDKPEEPVVPDINKKGFCRLCNCKINDSKSCDVCLKIGWKCEGECGCCREFRDGIVKLAHLYFRTTLEEAATEGMMCICKIDPPSCAVCDCTVFKRTCQTCLDTDFSCEGTCPCCEGHRLTTWNTI